MKKIRFADFEKIMLYDIVKYHTCIEIEFFLENSSIYTNCWLGKLIDNSSNEPILWFGLKKDGSQAYEFNTLDEFFHSKVFNGQSLKEVWELITIVTLDACNVEDRILFYLGTDHQPHRK